MIASLSKTRTSLENMGFSFLWSYLWSAPLCSEKTLYARVKPSLQSIESSNSKTLRDLELYSRQPFVALLITFWSVSMLRRSEGFPLNRNAIVRTAALGFPRAGYPAKVMYRKKRSPWHRRRYCYSSAKMRSRTKKHKDR